MKYYKCLADLTDMSTVKDARAVRYMEVGKFTQKIKVVSSTQQPSSVHT